MKRRRLRAIMLLEQELQLVIVAQMVGVDHRSARRWKRLWRCRRRNGVRARPAPGRPPKLAVRQRQTLVRCILRGPEAFITIRHLCKYPTNARAPGPVVSGQPCRVEMHGTSYRIGVIHHRSSGVSTENTPSKNIARLLNKAARIGAQSTCFEGPGGAWEVRRESYQHRGRPDGRRPQMFSGR